MIINDKKLADTVDKMERRWMQIVEETGDLTYEDMRKTLRRAQLDGEDVVAPRKESTLMKMNHYLIGETQLNCGVLY